MEIDLVLPNRVVEVEVKPNSLSQGMRQVARSQKPRYLAVSISLVKKALEATENTGIGVMSETGRIVKRASRKR